MRKLTEAEQTRITDRWKTALAAESTQRQSEIADLEFESGIHWDASVKAEREKAGKPCLTIDLIAGPIKQVTNQARQARPGIVVTPRGNGASKETAELWQAILRRIETNSNADYAYTWANQHQVKMGRGYWRVLPYYIDDSDEQDLKILWVDNQHTVYLDPTRKEPDGCDAKWAFVVEDMTTDDYEDRFGESSLSGNGDRVFQSLGDAPAEWHTKTKRRIAEYMYIETTSKTRYTLSDGTYVFEDLLERGPQKRDKGKFAPGDLKAPTGKAFKLDKGGKLQSRPVKTTTVHWMLTNGVEALEETILPGRYIPIVEIEGERRNINGQVDRRGMVRMAKDPQRMENYLESTVVETISLAPKSRWLVGESTIGNHLDMWQTANRKNWDALIWDDTKPNATPPIPVDREPPIQAAVIAAQRSAMQVRQIMGYVDVAADEKRSSGDAISGKAINARKLQQEMQSSDYMDNLGRGVRLTAKILHYMARETYDTPRLLRVKGMDDKEFEVLTHAGPEQQQAAQEMISEQVKHVLDLSAGDYDFAFSAGKSYQSQQQEAQDAMGQLFTAAPELAQVGADIWVGNMSWPGARELAERLKKANPLAQDDQQGKVPPQVQQRLMQLDQYAQAAHDQIAQLNQMIEAKTLELKSKEKIAADDNLTKIQIAQMQLGVQQDIAAMKAHIDKLEMMIGVAHEQRMQHQEHAHDVGLAAMGHSHAKEQMREQAIHGGMAADQQHAQGLESSEVGHQQALEQGEQGHEHAIQQLKAKPAPKNGASA